MNSAEKPQNLHELLLSPENLPLRKYIQEKSEIHTDSDLEDRVNQLSATKIEEISDLIHSMNVVKPDPKIHRKILNRLVGVKVHFSSEFHQVTFHAESPPLETEYTGKKKALIPLNENPYRNFKLTRDISTLKTALVNQLVQFNNSFIRKNQIILSANVKVNGLNSLTDLFNKFLPFEHNDLDALLSEGHFTNNYFSKILKETSHKLNREFPYDQLLYEENEKILEKIKAKEDRSLRLINMNPLATYDAIDFTVNNKYEILQNIVDEQLNSHFVEITADTKLLEPVIPKIIEAIAGRKGAEGSPSFSTTDLQIIETFFKKFLTDVLPDLSP